MLETVCALVLRNSKETRTLYLQIESLDTLVVLNNKSEFHNAVRLVIENVSFERNVTVQVFEPTIR